MSPPPPATYSVRGYVAGLTGSGLTLSYNGGASIAISRNGAFTAASNVSGGSMYSLTILDQPTGPAQTCAVSNGSGNVGSGNITSVDVFCPQAVGTRAYVVTAGNAFVSPVSPFVAGTVSVYTIDPTSGALTLVPGSTVTTGPDVGSFQLVPHSSSAWALNVGNVQANAGNYTYSSVYAYAVDSGTGSLTLLAGSPFLALCGTGNTPPGCPNGLSGVGITDAVTFYPSGTFGYASNTNTLAGQNAGTWTFTIHSATGAPMLGSSVPGCGAPLTIDPSGQFAYFVTPISGDSNTQTAALSAYTIDSSSGALTSVPGGPWTLAVGGDLLTIDPFGRSIYILSTTSGQAGSPEEIFAFAIDPSNGALTAVAGSPFAFPPEYASSMVIGPDGRFAYIIAPGGEAGSSVYTFSINASTGALSAGGNPLAQNAAVPYRSTLVGDSCTSPPAYLHLRRFRNDWASTRMPSTRARAR